MTTIGGSEKPTVLLVEDDDLVGGFLKDLLQEHGYDVLVATAVADAVGLVEGNPGIRAVVSDVETPGRLTGIDLAVHVVATRPDVAVVLISGRVRPDIRSLPGAARFVSKPFLPGDLLDELEDALNELA